MHPRRPRSDLLRNMPCRAHGWRRSGCGIRAAGANRLSAGGSLYARTSSADELGPNPALAGILAGFFPIGVGAVYTGQYAKGLSHLVIMVLLILGVSSDFRGPQSRFSEFRLASSTSTRSSTRFAAPKQFRWENLLPIRSARQLPLARERNSKAPRFRPEPPFSSAWVCVPVAHGGAL